VRLLIRQGEETLMSIPLSGAEIMRIAPTLSPTSPGRLVAFVTDTISEAALRSGLAGYADGFVARRGNVRHAVRFLEKDSTLGAIVVDIDGAEDPFGELEALARVCPPDVRVVVIGSQQEIAFYRALVNDVGVAEYLPKPLTRDAVERLLLRHFAPDQAHRPATRGGHVVAVCGASGGAGSTTIAVSTAIELARVAKGSVVLLDLNLQQGAAALMLGAHPGPGLRIALEDPAQADTLLLERTAIQIEPRMCLIAADESLESGISITEAGVTQLLSLVRRKFNFIVVDLPMPLRPELHQVLTLARQVVLVLEPDVASLRNARVIRQLATTMSGADRVVNVLNRANMKGGLPRPVVEKALGSPLSLVIPELGKRMPESMNVGIPAIRRVPALRKLLAPLIREIAGIDLARDRRSWLRRVFAR
jgi:pilus assembly protein CpaE